MSSQEFSSDLAEKLMVEMVIWSCRQESLKEWRECSTENEKEEKERTEKKGAGQRDKGEFKNRSGG